MKVYITRDNNTMVDSYGQEVPEETRAIWEKHFDLDIRLADNMEDAIRIMKEMPPCEVIQLSKYKKIPKRKVKNPEDQGRFAFQPKCA